MTETKLIRARWLPAFVLARKIPGVGLCGAVAVGSYALQLLEERLAGQAYIEALVIAILVGTTVRTAWAPSAIWLPGIELSAKLLLEVAVVLLGATVSLRAIGAAGPLLLLGIAGVVAAALCAGYFTCRMLGLPPRMAALIACGNAICGNSAIAAVAPVIGAHADDVASSIAFTAILGVIVVLGLPLLVPLLGLSSYDYGVLAGLTVYAVPQVLAATAPVGAVATQVGTLVKLVRVLALGPVVLALSLLVSRISGSDQGASALSSPERPRLCPRKLVPWFIVGFLFLALLRSCGFVPDAARVPLSVSASLLTVASMAGLGLGVDLRVVGRVGPRVISAVTVSLLLLFSLALGIVRILGQAHHWETSFN